VEEPNHNLAASLSTFYGRQREIADPTSLIDDHCLFKSMSTGGIGKTRIAVELGSILLGRLRTGYCSSTLHPKIVSRAIVTRGHGRREASN